MRFIIKLFAVAFGLAPSVAQAHDFWMDFGSRWRAAPNETLTLRFFVGHGAELEDWNFRRERIVAFRRHAGDMAKDISSALVDKSAGAPAGAALALEDEGSHLIAFETNEVRSELEPAKFEAYLREEGLAAALAARKGRETTPGREVYSRRAKAIVQVGDAATDTVSMPVGHTLEIVPERNPLMLGGAEPLPVRVLFNGAPLSGASVHLESLAVGLMPEQTKVTDGNGRAAFAFPHNGAWKLDVVWSVPIDNPEAEFRTVFASLTFSY
jgi:uncharacterized GH25 family protein